MDEQALADVAEIAIYPAEALVYEHGWQSWSPSRTYRLTDASYRPPKDHTILASYRPEAAAPPDVFQGQGLLVVQPASGAPSHVFAVERADERVPAIRARRAGDRLVVTANGQVRHIIDDGSGGIEHALARWADDFAAAAGVLPMRSAPTVWCTWYHYFAAISEAGVDENLAAMDDLRLPIEVVQVDDGWQRGIGDWLPPTRFRSVPELLARVRDRGRRAGLWVAPFICGSGSDVAREHPDWLVRDADGRAVHAGNNWDQELYGLDLTHPGVEQYLREVFTTLVGWGADYFKIDFLYAAALPGRRHEDVSGLAAYRRGLRLIRESIADAYLLGCGAPLLPSVGLVDAMRVSPDTAPHWAPIDGDVSQPGALAAVLTGAARAWQHGRFWVNDADCLIVRPSVERREDLAAHVERYGGLRASSDRLRELDDWGVETTRRLLTERPPPRFV